MESDPIEKVIAELVSESKEADRQWQHLFFELTLMNRGGSDHC